MLLSFATVDSYFFFMIWQLICKYEPFGQEVSVQSLILRLRPLDRYLLLILIDYASCDTKELCLSCTIRILKFFVR